MSIYKSDELTIRPVVVNFNKPKIISRQLQKQSAQFIKQIEDDLIILNDNIRLYQNNPCLETLQKIENMLSLIENKYPENVVALFPEYLHAIHNVLYPEIQLQKKLLTSDDVSRSQEVPQEFTSFIKELSPDSFADLLKLFASKYQEIDDLENTLDELAQKDEKLAYLIDNYTIQYVGGNNGKVFQISHLETGVSFIVRYGYRLNNPRDIENELISEFKDTVPNPFPPLLAARQGSYEDKYGNINVCFLEIMPWFPKNLATQQIKPKDANACMLQASDACLKLGQTLQSMQDKGFMHADLKPSNILLEYDRKSKSYNLKLMDRKTVLRTNDGIYEASLPQNFWYDKPLTTEGISAPELDTGERIDADKVHAYAIGINLFLTAIQPETYERIKSQFFARGSTDLRSIIMQCTADFPGEAGQALMDLIVKATQHHPSERPNVKEVLEDLQKIKQSIEDNLRESCKLGIIELKKIIPIYEVGEIRDEFASIITAIEKELDNPKDFTLLTLEKFIYTNMGNILNDSLNKHLNSNFEMQLKEHPIASKAIERTIDKAKPFRDVQTVIDIALKVENLCQQLPSFNRCKALIGDLKKAKNLDYGLQDDLDYIENTLIGLLNIDFDEHDEVLFEEVMSDVLEIKLQLFLKDHLNTKLIKQFPELQKEFELEITKARPLNSEAKFEALTKDLLKFNTKVFQQVLKEEKKTPDGEVSSNPNKRFESKF